MSFFKGESPDLKKMEAYCTCQKENDKYNIEVRSKQSKYLAVLCAHSLSELRAIRAILAKNGVAVDAIDNCE